MSETTADVKERPILFSARMIRCLLAGTKSQTRRVIKPQLGPGATWHPWEGIGWRANGLLADIPVEWRSELLQCPYGEVGDRLWVRETWTLYDDSTPKRDRNAVWYRADHAGRHFSSDHRPLATLPALDPADLRQYGSVEYALDAATWHPSIHMPRWASRITLEITDVRVQRLQEISNADALAEGIFQSTHGYSRSGPAYENGDGGCYREPVDAFEGLWKTIHKADGPNGWDANPWVWAISFRRL